MAKIHKLFILEEVQLMLHEKQKKMVKKESTMVVYSGEQEAKVGQWTETSKPSQCSPACDNKKDQRPRPQP